MLKNITEDSSINTNSALIDHALDEFSSDPVPSWLDPAFTGHPVTEIDREDRIIARACREWSEPPSNRYTSPEEERMYAEIAAEVARESAEQFEDFKCAFEIKDDQTAQEAFRRFHVDALERRCFAPQGIRLTRLTSADGRPLSKEYYLENGQLMKKVSPALGKGRYETVLLFSLLEMCDVLEKSSVDQALMYSVNAVSPSGLITTQQLLDRSVGRDIPGISSRSKKFFQHANAPGIVAIDYDPPKGLKPLTREELVEILCRAEPALKTTALVWSASASTFLYGSTSQEELRGSGGQRIYLAIRDASDTKRFMETLSVRLWLIQAGRIAVSSSGARLKRTLVDLALANPVQPDFVGGASCGAGVVQRRPKPICIWEGDPLATQALPRLTRLELQQYSALIEVAMKSAEPEAARRREEWRKAQSARIVETILEQNDASDLDLDAMMLAEKRAFDVLDKALYHMLAGDFIVQLATGEKLSVAQILKASDKYDGALTLDPLEPDYDGGRVVGKLYLGGKRPQLFSMAHGGATYFLADEKPKIELGEGRIGEYFADTLDVLRKHPAVFDSGDSLVQVLEDGRLETFIPHNFIRFLAETINFVTSRLNSTGGVIYKSVDPTEKLANMLLASPRQRGLRHLSAVVSAPLMLPDGSILSEQGYNKATGLYLKVIGDGWDAIPVDPTDAQLRDAYATLWHPFSMYPWADPIDASVALAGLLTACVRLGLSSAPAFGFDAPSASSGKTKAARVLCSLVDGRESAIVGYPSCSNDQEMSKMLVTKAMEGARSLLIDNVIGIFESAAFAAAMTTSTIEGRILGKSQMTGSLPCRMMTTITGNNLILGSDCSQRVIIARINARDERPHQRGFKFDPVDYAVENRCRIIVAGLTLLQGFVRAGMPRSSQKISRFAEWDRLVRQCVLWLQPKLGLDIADPLDAIERNRDSDPALESHDWMLRGLEAVFGGSSFTAKDLMDWHEMIKSRLGHIDANQRGLWDAIEGSANGKIRPTTLTVGNMLKFRKEKIVNTRFLECVGERHGGIKAWVVRRNNT